MSLLGPLLDQAEAAIIVSNPDFAFGCMGCARTDELVEFLVKQKKIPILELSYPADEDEGIIFVRKVRDFLTSLGGNS